MRNGLAPERQAILDTANANAQRLVADQKAKDALLIAQAEERARKAEEEAQAAKPEAREATAKARAAEEGVATAKLSILETVANALNRYRDERAGGASPTQAGLSAAGGALEDRERLREAAIIGAIQQGVQAREEGGGVLSMAQAIIGGLLAVGLGAGGVGLFMRRKGVDVAQVLLARLLAGDKAAADKPKE